MKLSLIIPVYNEEEVIDLLLRRAVDVLSGITENFEIICVDDGSSDRTFEKLVGFHSHERRLKIISFSRNFGHQAAYTAGLDHSSGDYVVMMDGDLQDPPELIPSLLEKAVEGGYDIVHARRTGRNDGFFKNLLFETFHFLFKKLSGMEEARNVGNFSLMNRRALVALLSFREKSRYLPGLRFFIGFRQGFVDYERDARAKGEAKMRLSALYRLAMDAIFSFSELPIRLCFFTGIAGMLICFFAFIYVLVSKFTGIAPFGWSSTTLSIYFMGFIQLIFLGILGEYVFRTYHESQNRPVYLIREIIE
ncbi:MAG: hypothetical protein B5M56_02380 [Desulfococcus sp. 4484_241]|nr:MAG: hypothetical protein B5M56_02380 [Desulfococcus sp. 4484_241]